VFADVLLVAAVLVLFGAGWLLVAVVRLRGDVRRAGWVLTRVSAAIGEAERAGRVDLADT
jgi:hypothetical protein